MLQTPQMSDQQMKIWENWVHTGLNEATEALTVLVGKPMKITAPKVGILPLQDVTKIIGGDDQAVIGIYVNLADGLSGHLLLLLSIDSALSLVDLIMGDEGQDKNRQPNEMDISCLSEVGNITAGHFIATLGDKIDKPIKPSSPLCSVDMASALLNTVLVDVSQTANTVFLVETLFSLEEKMVTGYFFLFPHPEAMQTIKKMMQANDDRN